MFLNWRRVGDSNPAKKHSRLRYYRPWTPDSQHHVIPNILELLTGLEPAYFHYAPIASKARPVQEHISQLLTRPL